MHNAIILKHAKSGTVPKTYKAIYFILCCIFCSGTAADLTFASDPTPVSVRTFGAHGNGTDDDTATFKAALNSSQSIVIPDGIYLITQELNIPDGSNITLSPHTVLQFHTNIPRKFLFRLQSVKNVHIQGNGGALEGDAHDNPHGIHGGIGILGASDNITVEGVTFQDFPDDTGRGGLSGDGVYIGGPLPDGTVPSNVTISKSIFLHNGRNQISVTAGSNIKIDGNKMSGTPLDGIDIEPNNDTDICTNITLTNNVIDSSRTGISVIRSASNILIEGNKISVPSNATREPQNVNDFEGIHIDCSSTNTVVKNNHIQGGFMGISATHGQATITGNEIIGSRRCLWVRYNDITLQNNRLINCWETAIRIQGNQAHVIGNFIQDYGDQSKLLAAQIGEAIGICAIDGYTNGILSGNTVLDTHPHPESRRVVRLPAPDKGGNTWQTDVHL